MGRSFVVGLGSNLGARHEQLARAVEQIAALPLQITALSRVYETAPLGPPQPDYLNAAVRATSELTAEALLDGLLAIEAAFGRVRDVRWGPRVLDLDILWSSTRWSSPRLTVPHAELTSRTFALAPLLDVAPELALSYGPALQELGGAPSAVGLLCFDRASGSCAFTSASAL